MTLLYLTYPLQLYEPISSMSHFIAAIGFLAFCFNLIRNIKGERGKIITVAFYAFATVATLLTSGIYHIYDPNDSIKLFLQKLDHSLIFLLIVGTIAPIHYILFKGFMRWKFIALVCIIITISTVIKLIYFEQFPEWLGTSLYVALGWGGAVSVVILWKRNSFSFVKNLIYGGVIYTIGAVFEYLRFPNIIEGVFEAHELFHFLVIIGLILHWKFVYKISMYKLPKLINHTLDKNSVIAA